MVSAYILINTQPGSLADATKGLTAIEGVKSVEAVTGPFDAIAFAEAPTAEELGHLVVSQIQKLSGIQKTLTCLVVSLEAARAA